MAVSLLSRVGVCLGMGVGVVITRFKAKSQFKLDFTRWSTGTELSNNKESSDENP